MRQSRTLASKYAMPLVLLAPILVLTGCKAESRGNPAPATTATPSSPQATSPPGGNVFGDLKACDLLEPITTTQGFSPAASETYESDNGCGASKPRYGTVAVYLVPNEGVSAMKPDGGQLVPTKVGTRDAVEIPGGGGKGVCTIGISVSENARATITLGLSNGGTNEQSCTDARAIAEEIAPKLPQGS
ncbi:DUF3558 family protein [Amycolatopsis sp. cmx-11-12]|uniref:DUF3558 family protein n=1 Tax=Amycolatopsis sp. cmx-11-12 TaxID=2785795 RepID=UPI0039183A9E